MSRQNRVLPTGEVVAAPFRGAYMGNRGILHDDHGLLGRARWRHPHWLICVLAFRGRDRQVMTPRRYTELFFHDEAVALAAGHRPCRECRHAAFERFRDAWTTAHGGDRPSAPAIDAALHRARLAPGSRTQRTYTDRLGSLPDGVFVAGPDGSADLWWHGQLHRYLGDRYAPPRPRDPHADVSVLTPKPTVGAISAGYVPDARLR